MRLRSRRGSEDTRGRSTKQSVSITLGENVDGLGVIVGDLLSENLADADRVRSLGRHPWSVVIDVFDASSTFSVVFDGSNISIHGGHVAGAALMVRLDGDTLMSIPETPLVMGLPDPRSGAGRALITKLLLGKVQVRGIVWHTAVLCRFLTVLSTVEPAIARS